jgi:FdhE protein
MSAPTATTSARPLAAHARLDSLAQAHPEWAPWLGVLRPLCAELSAAGWDAGVPATVVHAHRKPALAGAVLRPDGPALARLLERLKGAAREHGLHALAGQPPRPGAPEPVDEALSIFLAAVNADHAALDRHAARAGAVPEGFRSLAQLLAMPSLHACARRWSASAGPAWSQGHCPVCGAWAAFAEVRGIERARHLRCGRCGAGWPMPVLACTYCGTTEHARLGSLVVDDRTARFSIDVCRHCSGYLKSCTTLQATPPDEVLLLDLASVAFDLAAVERGFLRPPEPAVALGAVLGAREPVTAAAPRWGA